MIIILVSSGFKKGDRGIRKILESTVTLFYDYHIITLPVNVRLFHNSSTNFIAHLIHITDKKSRQD